MIRKAAFAFVCAFGLYALASMLLVSATEDRCATTSSPLSEEVSGSRMERSLVLPMRWTCLYRDDHGTEVERRTMWVWTD